MIKTNSVLITGASGFIGRHLVDHIESMHEQFIIYVLVRKITNFPSHIIQIECSDIANIEVIDIPWSQIGIVIHLAARAHILKDKIVDPLTEFRRVNRDATSRIAAVSASYGVKRFVFLSSIGVLGNFSASNSFNEDSEENPHADYAISKLEAEHAIKKICEESQMEYTIIRPPLVIGKDAPGNFELLLKLIVKKVPLPFSLIKNKRSFIFFKNLTSFIMVCATHINARNQIFVIADEPTISTPQLILELSKGLKTKSYLFPVPVWVLKLGSIITSKKGMYIQLCKSLEIDITKAKTVLDWKPPHSLTESLHNILHK